MRSVLSKTFECFLYFTSTKSFCHGDPKDIKQMNLFELVLESEAIEQKEELMRDEDGREYEQRGIQCYCTLALSLFPNYDATPTLYIYSF